MTQKAGRTVNKNSTYHKLTLKGTDLDADRHTCPNEDVSVLGANSFIEKTWKDDFTLIVESRKLYVAKAVLAYVSPVFERMFQSDFKEKNQDEMELPDKKYDDVLEFLRCVGPGKQTDICERNVYRIVPLADEYQVSYLKSSCEDFLIGKVREETSADDIYDMLQLALTYNMDQLYQICVTEASKKSIEDLDRALIKVSIPLKTIGVIKDNMLRRLEIAERENRSLQAVNKYLLFQVNEADRKKIQETEGWEGVYLEFTLNVNDLKLYSRTQSKEFRLLDTEAKLNIKRNPTYCSNLMLEISFDSNKIHGWEISVLGRFAVKNCTKKNQDFIENFKMLLREGYSREKISRDFSKIFVVEEGYIYHGKMDTECYILANKKKTNFVGPIPW